MAIDVRTGDETRLERKYALLRAKRAREGKKIASCDANDDGEGKKSLGESRAKAQANAKAKEQQQNAEAIDPAIERAKAILHGVHKQKPPGKANAEDGASKRREGKARVTFTMAKREAKASVADWGHEDAGASRAWTNDVVIGYASTEVGGGEADASASVAVVASASVAVVEREPTSASVSARERETLKSLEKFGSLDAMEAPAMEAKKEIKRPGVMKRPGVLVPAVGSKKPKTSAPTPFPEATDGVGERQSKTGREIFVGDLPDQCTVEILTFAFYRFGRVNSCRVIEHRNMGFVTFAEADSAARAVHAHASYVANQQNEPIIVGGNIVHVDHSDNFMGDSTKVGSRTHREEIRQRALEELERIRDGEIVAEPEIIRRDMLVYDEI